MKKSTFFLMVAILASFSLTAQNKFVVTRATGITYSSIGAAGSSTTWQGTPTTGDDCISNDVIIPFSFSFMGNSFSRVRISTNGYISFMAPTSTPFSNSFASNAGGLDSIVAPFWDDLVTKGNTVASLSTSIKYQTIGSSPNRIFVVEWIGMERFSAPGPNLNFQVKLFETTNVIEFVYGVMDPSNATLSYSLGVRATSIDYVAQQMHNTNYFTDGSGGGTSLYFTPICNSKITFTPSTTFSAGAAPIVSPPINDESTGAIQLSIANGGCTNSCSKYYTTEGATASAGITLCSATTPGTPDDDVWFKFVATATSHTITIVGCGGYDPVLQVFNSSLTSLNCVNANNTSGGTETLNLTGLTVGSTYLFRVYHAASGNGTTPRISVCVSSAVTAPANDDCSGAVSLTVGDGFCTSPVTGTLIGATPSTGAPSFTCGTSTLTNDVWYKVLVQAGKTVTVQTSAVNATAGNNMLLQVIHSSNNACGGTLTSRACDDNSNDDEVSDFMSKVTFTNSGTSDSTYFLRVIANEDIDISDFAICAWNSGIIKPISVTGGCTQNSINIDSAYKYTWVPLTDVSGDIIAEIFPNGNKLGNTTFSYYINSGSVRTSNIGVKYLDRNISISPTTQPATPVLVRLYYKSTELAALQAADPNVLSTNLNATKTSNTCSNSATNIAGGGTFLTQNGYGKYNTSDSFIVVTASSFSTFFLHGGTTLLTLPLRLVNFDGLKHAGYNELIWQTADEVNTKEFELEKSKDGIKFDHLYTVPAKGNGNNNYSYIDAGNITGKMYYRLKCKDIDGRFTYSKVVVLNAESSLNILLYPNPTGDILTISGAKIGSIFILTDVSGKLLNKISASKTTFSIDMSRYCSGVYLLKTSDGYSQKVVKL